MDSIHLSISSLNFRSTFNGDSTSQYLLSDTHLSVLVKRALSAVDVTSPEDTAGLPDIDAAVTIDAFAFSISESQVKLLAHILSGNLTEYPLKDPENLDTLLESLPGLRRSASDEKQVAFFVLLSSCCFYTAIFTIRSPYALLGIS